MFSCAISNMSYISLYLPISPHISCAISNMSFSLETSFFFISLTCEMQGDAGRCREMQGDIGRYMEIREI